MISGRSGTAGRRIPSRRDEADADRRAADERARAGAELARLVAPEGTLAVDGLAWRVSVSVDLLGDAHAHAAPLGLALVPGSATASRRGRTPEDVAAELREELLASIADAIAGIRAASAHLDGDGVAAELRALLLGLYADDKPRHRAIRSAARLLVSRGESDPRIRALAAMIDP